MEFTDYRTIKKLFLDENDTCDESNIKIRILDTSDNNSIEHSMILLNRQMKIKLVFTFYKNIQTRKNTLQLQRNDSYI